MRLDFPDQFRWGTATAAAQIEGSPDADGRGASVWDVFAADPNRIDDRKNPAIACDHYRLMDDDVALMARLGYPNYRFSLAWPRFFPTGSGPLNSRGAAFYDRLVDRLLENQIEPFVTLFHWDLPQALQESGGWANRETVARFADYAHAAGELLGDRVKFWMTHNEPWVYAFVGHLFGSHAPGIRDLRTALTVAHHLLVAHGRAVPALREMVGAAARIGIVNNLEWIEPATADPADIAAAARHDGAFNRWYLDPVIRGSYPADMMEWYGDAAPPILDGDLAAAAVKTDFMGVNYYTRRIIAHDANGGFLRTRQVRWPFVPRSQYEEWENNPEGLYRVLVRLKTEYGNPPVFISENGTPLAEDAVENGRCADPARIAYLQNHTAAAWQAIKDGADIRGYFVWSFMDNFEWNFGFTKRFGLVHVDYAGQTRTVKESGRWYSGVCRDNGFSLSS